MKLSITVKPGSKKPGIEILSDSEWIVRVREPATEGKANIAIIEAVAEQLNISKSKVVLVRGSKSKHKIIEIS
jgi:hypothetical protein